MDEGRKKLHSALKEIIKKLVWGAYTEKQILDLVRRYYKSGIKERDKNTMFFKTLIEGHPIVE